MHTPGPWIDRHFDQNGQIVIEALAFRGPNVLALVRHPMTLNHEKECFDCTPDDVNEATANARLIAAAPDLLAAGEALLEAVRKMPNLLLSYPSMDVITAMSDAIAKARQEPS